MNLWVHQNDVCVEMHAYCRQNSLPSGSVMTVQYSPFSSAVRTSTAPRAASDGGSLASKVI